jgi:hypothetical protein
MSMYKFLHNLLNVLVQIANKMGFKRKKYISGANGKNLAGQLASIATGCKLGYRRSIPDRVLKYFSSQGLLTTPHSHICYCSCIQGYVRPGRETDYTPPSSVEVKNDGVIPAPPNLQLLHGLVLYYVSTRTTVPFDL